MSRQDDVIKGAKSRPAGRPRKPADPADDQSSRDRLLDAAIQLFAQHGYQGVTTGQVAAVAGMAQSMVHYRFHSKSKLWKASIDRVMAIRGALPPASSPDWENVDPLTRLKILIRRFIEINAAHPELARLGLQEGMHRSARLRWLISKYVGATYRQFDDAIDEAREKGLIRDLPTHEVTNIILIAASLPYILGAWMQEVYRVRVEDPHEIDLHSDTLMKILFEGLQIRDAAPVTAVPEQTPVAL